jgi:hypothetical protein
VVAEAAHQHQQSVEEVGLLGVVEAQIVMLVVLVYLVKATQGAV